MNIALCSTAVLWGDARSYRVHWEPGTHSGAFHPSEGSMSDKNQAGTEFERCKARPGAFPLGSPRSRAAARAMLAEQPLYDFIVDMNGLPVCFPTPLTEYVDCGDCITHEVTRTTDSGKRTMFRRVIRKDSEEYRKAVEQGHD